MARFEHAPEDEMPRREAFTSSDSGVWARPRADTGRPQDRPLLGARRLPPWLSWCLALAVFVGIGAIVVATLLELTSELVELGHSGESSARPAR
jgi:hypothetical protein